MIRRLIFALALLLPCSLQAQDPPVAQPPAEPAPQPAKPPGLPMAVKALQYLTAQPNSGPTSWTNGPYSYDGAGNITGIGSEAYVYDKVGRLQSAAMRGPDLTSMQTQSYAYDVYGNLTSTTKLGQTVSLPITPEANSNQLADVGYDAAGNVVAAGTLHYEYDAVGMLSTVKVDSSAKPRIIYAYTADDERLFAFDVEADTTRWTVRGMDNKVLRIFKQGGANWSVERDYIYRGTSLLGALKPGGAVEHYSLDHLGSVRLVTDGAGQKIGYHVYWPFGEEWSLGNPQEDSPLKFTGHERNADPSGSNNPLDYMHARYYRSGWGRFLSVDPVINVEKNSPEPQRWNRNAYVTNNPLLYADLDGRDRYQEPGFTKPYSEWSKALRMDESTPTVVRASVYATGGLTAAGTAGFLGVGGLIATAKESLVAAGGWALLNAPRLQAWGEIALDFLAPPGPGRLGTFEQSANRLAGSLQFTETTMSHMKDAGRVVPRSILARAILTGARSADPQDVEGAVQITSPIARKGKEYILTIIYREADNTVLHFQYGPAK